jgi:hypothetical protein
MNPASFVDWIESRDLPATALTVAAAVLIAVLAWSYQDRAKPDAANEDEVKAHTRRRRTRIITSGTAGTIAFTVLLIWGPWWIEGHHLRDDKGNLVASAGIIVTGFRTMLIALAAGGFTAAGLYYTREKHRLEREQFDHAQQQFAESQKQFETTLRETQESQVTGRYVEAIKLVASDKVFERLGGIYSLERIMQDSSRDRAASLEVLSAFVRRESRRLPIPDEVRSDVQAAITVIARRQDQPGDPRVNLEAAHLARTNLRDADLTSANLISADLTYTGLIGATLVNADLSGATLIDANLAGADCLDAEFHGADLGGARMSGARNLTEIQLLSAWPNDRTEVPGHLNTAAYQERVRNYEARLP